MWKWTLSAFYHGGCLFIFKAVRIPPTLSSRDRKGWRTLRWITERLPQRSGSYDRILAKAYKTHEERLNSCCPIVFARMKPQGDISPNSQIRWKKEPSLSFRIGNIPLENENRRVRRSVCIRHQEPFPPKRQNIFLAGVLAAFWFVLSSH